jgi:hypothetical protein
MFAVSCINTLAQSYQAWLDEQQQQQEQAGEGQPGSSSRPKQQ